MDSTVTREPAAVGVLRALVTVVAATFLVASPIHLGLRIPLGFATLAEPRILPAAVVEGACGLVLLVAAWGLFARKRWAWTAAIVAQLFALAGVALGIFALAMGRGPTTTTNFIYHRVIAVALVAGLALVLSPAVRRELGPAR